MKALELCAGGGGQAIGLESAGYENAALVEIDAHACETLSKNRPNWDVVHTDLKDLDPCQFKGVDIICGGVPCQPFSIAGQQLGQHDERDCFPHAVRFVEKLKPIAFFFENVRGLSGSTFDSYRTTLLNQFAKLGYHTEWKVLEASNYGVPQLRPRFILVGRCDGAAPFPWPTPQQSQVTVATSISDLLGINDWKQLNEWKELANRIAPTIVGGSKKHGGPDLGPTRAKKQWAEIGIDGMGIANEAPFRDFLGRPRLTNRMVARIQGFPDTWEFAGGKTSVYRQIGNAFPPPVAKAVGLALKEWMKIKPIHKRPTVRPQPPEQLGLFT